MNTVILSMCHDFMLIIMFFFVTAVIIGGLCARSAYKKWKIKSGKNLLGTIVQTLKVDKQRVLYKRTGVYCSVHTDL